MYKQARKLQNGVPRQLILFIFLITLTGWLTAGPTHGRQSGGFRDRRAPGHTRRGRGGQLPGLVALSLGWRSCPLGAGHRGSGRSVDREHPPFWITPR